MPSDAAGRSPLEGNRYNPHKLELDPYAGIDNATCYRLSSEDRRNATSTFTGCGNTPNMTQPHVLQLVSDRDGNLDLTGRSLAVLRLLPRADGAARQGGSRVR